MIFVVSTLEILPGNESKLTLETLVTGIGRLFGNNVSQCLGICFLFLCEVFAEKNLFGAGMVTKNLVLYC